MDEKNKSDNSMLNNSEGVHVLLGAISSFTSVALGMGALTFLFVGLASLLLEGYRYLSKQRPFNLSIVATSFVAGLIVSAYFWVFP
jgi:hypothetical protein